MRLRSIEKRDGRLEAFNPDKIRNAVLKAMRATGVTSPNEAAAIITRDVVDELEIKYFSRGLTPKVEEIQDLVEFALMRRGYYKTAKAYIIYREKRSEVRSLSFNIEIIDKYLYRKDWRVKENSNMTYSLQGLNHYISSSLISQYWLRKLYPEEVRRAHLSGDMHIHDLGVLGPYCVGWDLQDLLLRGFGGVPGKVESRPPRHFRTALGQIVNFFYTLQGEAAGAQAFSNFDTYLAPFVRFDNLSYKEVKQAIQEFVFNLNVPTRVGFQTPFTNLTMDLTVPEFLAEENIIYAGEIHPSLTYGEFQKEMDMINVAFAEVMLEGDAKGRIFTFPIPTYNISKNFQWDKKELTPIWEMTAKYGIPYFANFVNSSMDPSDVRSMCCRLQLNLKELEQRGGGLFGANPLTGSIGVVTVNLPRIGYLATDENEFFERLEAVMETAKISLEIKRKTVEDFTRQDLYPYSKHYLEGVFESSGRKSYWRNHFSTIGIVGMHETTMNFLGEPLSSPTAKEFAIKVLKFMRGKLLEFQEETGNLYNLEATPAESASYRLAKLDKTKFGDDIYTSGQAEPFYTNSVHLPVDYTDDLFEVLEHQNDLQVLFTGGTVVHIFVGERIEDPDMAKELIRKIVHAYEIPYITLTPTFSISPVSGYIPGNHPFDPNPLPEEVLKEYGTVVELSEEELQKLPKGSYVVIEDS